MLEDDDDSVIIPISTITTEKPILVTTLHLIPHDALQAFVSAACSTPCNDNFLPKWRQTNYMLDLEYLANPVVHPVTRKTIDRYKTLANDPVMREISLHPKNSLEHSLEGV
jgi:hypothetical protein